MKTARHQGRQAILTLHFSQSASPLPPLPTQNFFSSSHIIRQWWRSSVAIEKRFIGNSEYRLTPFRLHPARSQAEHKLQSAFRVLHQSRLKSAFRAAKCDIQRTSRGARLDLRPYATVEQQSSANHSLAYDAAPRGCRAAAQSFSSSSVRF